jgi:alkanesulfonate monooxygenase SsuD/methylene tetrahydromethanopterin reductase-like flavin-dependent oxidoreductase (luciferase family)
MTELIPDRPFKLGFLTHVHGPGRSAGDVYRDLIETFTFAESLGFDGGWVAQHHLRDDFGRLPSPHVLLAAVAAATSHIELGTAVTVLPLEEPLRLAEDVAVLDALSGGRVQLGLGSGGANTEAFSVFGKRPEDRHQHFDESLAVLRGALEDHPLPGSDLSEGSPPLRLQPSAPGMAARLWQSTSDTDRARRAAEVGDGLLLGTAVHDPRTVQRPLAEAYLSAWSERPDPSTAVTPPQPRLGVVRAVFPAADRSQARDDLAPAIDIHRRAFVRHGLTELADLSTDEYLARINVHYGNPEELAAGLLEDPALFPLATYFIPVVQHELSTLDADLRRLELIATEIAPALGWQPARALALQ